MKRYLVAIIGAMMALSLYASNDDEISSTVAQIRSSRGYYQLRQILFRNTPLLLSAANNAYTVKKYVTNFRAHPFSGTKNIIQHGGSLLAKKGKLDLLVQQLVHTIDGIAKEVHIERVSTRKALRDLTRTLSKVSQLFSQLGRMRKVHKIGQNVTTILALLQKCKRISHSDEVVFIIVDEIQLEKEVNYLNEQIKMLKRKHGIKDSKL